MLYAALCVNEVKVNITEDNQLDQWLRFSWRIKTGYKNSTKTEELNLNINEFITV